MKKILTVIGPTATSKTDLGITLAKKYQGEIISCDSRQVYQGLDIGTGKLPSQNTKTKLEKHPECWLMDGISVYMYDVADPKLQFTVKDYLDQAKPLIDKITSQNKLPIIVGGTGLYLKALLDGLPNLDIPCDRNLRAELEKLNLHELQQKLQTVNPKRWSDMNRSDRQNPRRLLRSIELTMMSPYKLKTQNSNLKTQSYEVLKIGLSAPRDVINEKINRRLISRLDQGLIEEAKNLHNSGLSFQRMRELGLEYGCLADFLEGKIIQEEFVNKLQNKIHQYAKRQMTWFKKDPNIFWFDITKKDWEAQVDKLTDSWYHLGGGVK